MDRASPNRKLMRLHKGALDATGIVYKVYDPFSEDKRHLYFISATPSGKNNAKLLVQEKILGKHRRNETCKHSSNAWTSY